MEKDAKLLSLFSSKNSKSLRVPAGTTIIAQGDEVKSLFRINSGLTRLCVYADEGQRSIVAFHGPDEIVGLGKPPASSWDFSIEAVTSCIIDICPIGFIDSILRNDCDIRDGALLALRSEIEFRDAHLVMTTVLPAVERVYSFLLTYSRTRSSNGFIALPMSRRDIGDYLGLSMETVCRSFSSLRNANRIETKGAERYRIVGKVHESEDRDFFRAA